MAVSSIGPTKLPNPLSGLADDGEDDDERQTSIFTNYFHKAEEAKLAILEHHVKLTTEQLKTNTERKKRKTTKAVCISFQRGRCRFGSKCRFAHSMSSEANESTTDMSSETSVSAPKFRLLPSAQMPLNFEPHDADDDSYNAQKKRKHRSGVTDTLQPPKRAMQSLEQQRKQERPWTVTKR